MADDEGKPKTGQSVAGQIDKNQSQGDQPDFDDDDIAILDAIWDAIGKEERSPRGPEHEPPKEEAKL